MDKPFCPTGPTFLVTTTAVQAPLQVTGNSFRVLNLSTTAVNYLTWGSVVGITAAGAPAAGTPSAQTIGLAANAERTVSGLMPSSGSLYFISSLVVGFNVTQGDGL